MKIKLAALATPADSGSPAKRRAVEIYCKCRDCHDYVNVVFWVKKLKDDKDGVLYSGKLEPTSDVRTEKGLLYHRCKGVLVALNIPYRIRIDGTIN